MTTGDSTPAPIKVFVVDDEPLFRLGLIRGLEQQPHIEVAGEAGLHPDVARDVQNSTADVVLIGVADEPARAMEACRSITSLTSARCLVLGDPETERTATSGSPESGANALLAKGTPLIELIELVESVVLEQSAADGPGPNKYRGT